MLSFFLLSLTCGSKVGYKLDDALKQLDVDVAGKVALDSGLSTGGFTDCLLQYGISFVYRVDVGYGLVFYKIRTDFNHVISYSVLPIGVKSVLSL